MSQNEFRELKRAKIITLFTIAKLSPAQIVRKTKYPKSTVYGVCKRYINRNSLKDKPRKGRPTKITKLWNEISIDTLKKLIDSVPKRLQLVIEKKGDLLSVDYYI